MSKQRLFILVGITLFLSGCSLAPEYTRPEAPIPADWSRTAVDRKPAASNGTPVSAVPQLKWQEFFTDERLQKIIDIALKNNRDLRLAALNVERARALYGIQRAGLFPVVNAVGIGSKERVPADLSSTGNARISEKYAVNLGITSWEIDFFGRIRSLKERALEAYLATDQARSSAQISLMSSVAQAFLVLAADRESLSLVQFAFETRQAAYDLIRRRSEVGLATELDLRRAQTLVDAARGELARYTQQVVKDENALNLLLGTPLPDTLLPADVSDIAHPREISPGIGSEVLLLRPDILQAEHQLKGAYANIGAARAAFFPRISLTSAVGTASADLSGLFSSGSATWSFVPQISIPIFDARTWSAYRVTKVDREIAVAQYEKAIQTAFKEVADTLAERSTVGQRIAAQESLVDAVADTYRLSNKRYIKGIDSYLSVLDAQRSLYAAQQELVALRLAKLVNQVKLFAVLGGGVE